MITEAGNSNVASACSETGGGATGAACSAAGILIFAEPDWEFNPARDKRWVTRLRARSKRGWDPGGRVVLPAVVFPAELPGMGAVIAALGGSGAPGGGVMPGPRTATGTDGLGGASDCFFLPKNPKNPDAMDESVWRSQILPDPQVLATKRSFGNSRSHGLMRKARGDHQCLQCMAACRATKQIWYQAFSAAQNSA